MGDKLILAAAVGAAGPPGRHCSAPSGVPALLPSVLLPVPMKQAEKWKSQ